MDTNRQTDASLLWNDVCLLLEEKNMTPATLAMLKSCEIVDFLDDRLTISTPLSFVKRKIEQEKTLVEACLSEVSFQKMSLCVLVQTEQKQPVPTTAEKPSQETSLLSSFNKPIHPKKRDKSKKETKLNQEPANILEEKIPVSDSKLTFDHFVSGEENILAFNAAKQVANGESRGYNPLFIYGKSGLGKTHLLRAIQNYISENDPTRLCIYRSASQFVEDYRLSMNDPSAPPKNILAKNYQDLDVLIIDDIQNMSTAAGSIHFFFETFNTLISKGKQIVMAADRSPSQLGIGETKFDERDTSRMDSGVTISIQPPNYELKLSIIKSFYNQMKNDAQADHISGFDGDIPDDLFPVMAKRAGTSIRLIKGFVQSCLILGTQKQKQGTKLNQDDIVKISEQKWPMGQHIIAIEQIQKTVESYYDITHEDLIGQKRNKELMEPRHIAIWLARDMTDNTLSDIGKKFGNRTHATIKHSLTWVDDMVKSNRLFYDRLNTIRTNLIDDD